MIVKIQQSLFGNSPNKTMLIYNKNRSIRYEDAITEEVSKLLGKRPKAYFEAKIIHGKITIFREVKTQEW